MNLPTKKPILVTGSHRSGSTWVGKMLALSNGVSYIHEPFNLKQRKGICRANFDYWFQYICEENEDAFKAAINDTIQFKYSLMPELNSSKSTRDLVRLLRDYGSFSMSRMLSMRPLLKDPISIFSAQWLADTFDMEVVVLIRHPAAFAGSLKAANWPYPFSHLLNQPLLMEQHLEQYRELIEDYSSDTKNIIDQSILLWNIIHHMILQFRQRNPNWIFIRHEDLSSEPLEGFESIYSRLGLDYNQKVRKVIEQHSQTESRLTPGL